MELFHWSYLCCHIIISIWNYWKGSLFFHAVFILSCSVPFVRITYFWKWEENWWISNQHKNIRLFCQVSCLHWKYELPKINLYLNIGSKMSILLHFNYTTPFKTQCLYWLNSRSIEKCTVFFSLFMLHKKTKMTRLPTILKVLVS